MGGNLYYIEAIFSQKEQIMDLLVSEAETFRGEENAEDAEESYNGGFEYIHRLVDGLDINACTSKDIDDIFFHLGNITGEEDELIVDLDNEDFLKTQSFIISQQTIRLAVNDKVRNYVKNNPFSDDAIKKWGSNLIKKELVGYKKQFAIKFNADIKLYYVVHQESGIVPFRSHFCYVVSRHDFIDNLPTTICNFHISETIEAAEIIANEYSAEKTENQMVLISKVRDNPNIELLLPKDINKLKTYWTLRI